AATTPVVAGGVASFTITAQNTGDGVASNVVITDTLQGTGWSINPAVAGCAIAAGPPQVLTCTFATLAAGASQAVTVQKTTAAPADCGTINNTANVTGTGIPVDTDDAASASIVVNCPDLSLAKTAATTPVTAGGVASFTITATNTSSPAAAVSNVVI